LVQEIGTLGFYNKEAKWHMHPDDIRERRRQKNG